MKEALELLGLPAKDKITNFEGIIESIAFDLYGCIQLVIKPPSVNGKIKDGHWFDVNRIEILEGRRIMRVPNFEKKLDGSSILEYDNGPAEKPIQSSKT